MPKLIGLIGYPVRHSISPYFQQAALDYYQLDIRYQAWETAPQKLEATIAKLREPQNLGANVTVPHKEAVLPLLDEVDELASLIGAVNTIVKKDNKLWGFNTDAHGFLQALHKEGHFNPEGKRVVILGAGGVARAVCFALMREKANSVLILNRTLVRAKALADSLRSHMAEIGLKTEVTTLPWQSLTSGGTFDRCHLIVNCTSVGMKDNSQEGQSPLSLEVIPRGILVYDLVYNPCPTPLLQLAQKAGANILDGLSMLVYQGVASFELWTGKEAPVDIMLQRAGEVIGGKR
jgi:shikimate dehydrogenase